MNTEQVDADNASDDVFVFSGHLTSQTDMIKEKEVTHLTSTQYTPSSTNCCNNRLKNLLQIGS